MRIAIMGSGSIGGLVGGRLASVGADMLGVPTPVHSIAYRALKPCAMPKT